MRCLTIITGCAILLSACEKDEHYEKPAPPVLIVEGWIEDGGFPIVMLTQPIPVDNYYRYTSDLRDNVIKWAKVTVSDGTDTVVLTGKYDDRYFPPYVYTTSWIKGEAGKTYTLTAEYRDFHATATTTIPFPPEHCTFTVEPCADSVALYQIKAHFIDNPDTKNYYQIFSRVGTKTRQYQASYFGSIDDDVLNKAAEIVVYRGQKIENNNSTRYFRISDTVSVKVAQVDKASFEFWNSYTQMLSLSKIMFLATSSDIETNICGGYGYWCGYGAITDYIVIRDSVESDR